MSRLAKKCVVASSTFHGLLLLVLFFGSALMPKPDERPFNPITVYSAAQVSDALTRGGEPVAAPQTPAPLPPTPPQTKPVETPAPQKPEPPVKRIEPPKPVPLEKSHVIEKLKPEIKEIPIPTPPKTQHKIVIDDASLKPTRRKADEKAKAAQDAADAESRAQTKRRAQEFASSLKSISRNLSSKTPLVELSKPGFGGGGEVSVNYNELIQSMYYNAWVAPMGLTDETPIVEASITVARSGDVTSARITKSSGNSLMDRSIEHVLETVKFIEPFPTGSRDETRNFTIRFNLQAKRQIG